MAATLSVIPGLGQIYVGESGKALALFCIDAGIFAGLFFSHSIVIFLLSLGVYFVTMIPASLQAYRSAGPDGAAHSQNSAAYVILMLLLTGFSALPLLWQSGRFSHRSKVWLTTMVFALAVLFFGSLILWGPKLEKFLRHTV